MVKGFTKHANEILTEKCMDECRINGEEMVLPEHLILCILKDSECYGAKIIENLKLNVAQLKFELSEFIADSREQKSSVIPFPKSVVYSRRTLTLVDVAVVESRTLRCQFIGTEHLLIASCREDNSVMNNFLKKSNCTISDLRKIAAELDSSREFPPITGILGDAQIPLQSRIFEQNPANRSEVFRRKANGESENPKKAASSFLAEYSKNLTEMYADGLLDPIIGRENEINRAIEILERRTKNNPVLVGEPGVGKTAIVEGLAQAICNGKVSKNLLNKKIYVLDLASLIAGTKFRGEFEDRIKKIIRELKENKNIILFIDEIHTLIGAGSGEGTMDAANILKPALSRGEIQCIGSTTSKEYRKYFEKDSALERRFQKISVEEPSEKETVDILNGIKTKFERFHGVKYKDSAIELIAKYSKRYITSRYLPDKAIDVLDEAGSVKKIRCSKMPSEFSSIQETVSELTELKESYVAALEFEKAAQVRDRIRILSEEEKSKKEEWLNKQGKDFYLVNDNDICFIISRMTGIPMSSLDKDEIKRLKNVETELNSMVVGQEESVKLLTSCIRRSRAGVSSLRRPTGSFIFLGPTGVGKTLLAKSLAKVLFGSEDALLRIDMSDFMEKHNTSRLVGSPPGYVGFDEGGSLTERVRKNPYSVILFDEIEKAHPDVFNILLQVLEEGELVDNLGHTVSFRNSVIIMTSNAGVRKIATENRLGFSTSTEAVLDYDEIKVNAIHELKKIMNPELLNRIDEVLVFHALGKEEIFKILDLQIDELNQRLGEQSLTLKLSKSLRDYLVENGYDASMGARPMRRLLQREIEERIANCIIDQECSKNDVLFADYKNSKVSIRVKKGTRKENHSENENEDNLPVDESIFLDSFQNMSLIDEKTENKSRLNDILKL